VNFGGCGIAIVRIKDELMVKLLFPEGTNMVAFLFDILQQ
jgi:hypothetical protein